MNIAVKTVVVILALISPQSPSKTPQTPVSSFFRIDSNHAGIIEKGLLIDTLYRRFTDSQLHLMNMNYEGSFSPAVIIMRTDGQVKRSVVIDLDIDGARRWVAGRITILDDRYRTDNGIRVGSIYADVQRAYDVLLLQGEGNVIAKIPSPNIRLSLNASEISEVHGQTRVESIIIP